MGAYHIKKSSTTNQYQKPYLNRKAKTEEKKSPFPNLIKKKDSFKGIKSILVIMNSESHNLFETSERTLNLECKLPNEKKVHTSPLNRKALEIILIDSPKNKNYREQRMSLSPGRKKNFENKFAFKVAFQQEAYASSGKINNSVNHIGQSRKEIMNQFKISRTVHRVAKKMIKFIQNKLLFSSVKLLRKYHFNIINDNAAFFNEAPSNNKSEQDKVNTEMNKWKLNALLQKYALSKIDDVLSIKIKVFDFLFPLIDPNNIWKILWDLFVFFCVLLKILWVTIELSFGVELRTSEEFMWFNITLFILIFVDSVATLNTVYYKEGLQITDRRNIIKHYFQKHFIPDLLIGISVFFMLFLKDYSNIQYVSDLLNFLKILKFFETEERLKAILIRNIRIESLYKIIGLFSKIFLVAHVLACLWFQIGYRSAQEDSDQKNWLVSKDLLKEKLSTKYLYSIYWGFTTMLTVGYGDIVPTNTQEMFFTIWAMLIGCVIFGYSLNYIGEILTSAGRSDRQLKEQLAHVTDILRKKKLPQELQTRVLKYLEFIWKQELSENPEQENLLMSKLSSKLRDEVYLHTNVHYLKNVKAFRVFKEKTLIKLASLMKKIRYSPEESIYKAGDRNDSSIYFIIDGRLVLLMDKRHSKAPLQTLMKNDYFGLHELFSDDTRQSSIVSSDFSSLFQLSRKDFLSVLSEEPQEYEKFCKLRDEMILYNQVDHLQVECASCFMKDHRVENCKFLKYEPDKLKVIAKCRLEGKNFEKKFSRRKYERKNTLSRKISLEIDYEQLQQLYEGDEDFSNLRRLYSSAREEGEEKEFTDPDLYDEDEYMTKIATKKNEKKKKTELQNKPHGFKVLEKAQSFRKNETLKKKNDKSLSDSLDFDRIRSFQYYYVNTNIENIINSSNVIRRKLMKQKELLKNEKR